MWNKPETTPEAPKGEYVEGIVALKYPNKPKPVVQSAFYLNEFTLMCEWGCAAGLSDEECEENHEDGVDVSGWYEGRDFDGVPNGSFHNLTKDAELLGWQPMPIWSVKGDADG